MSDRKLKHPIAVELDKPKPKAQPKEEAQKEDTETSYEMFFRILKTNHNWKYFVGMIGGYALYALLT